MLFNSPEFLFVFLPAALAAVWISLKAGRPAGLFALVFASLAFYAWWAVSGLALIGISIAVNFGDRRPPRPAARARRRATAKPRAALARHRAQPRGARHLQIYELLPRHGGTAGLAIILPLGISFSRFQQIAYLVDSYKRKAPRYGFGEYCLFVTFFPQLIAGPIVHHNEIMPQLQSTALLRPRALNLSLGLAIFAVGLFKKTVIADGLAQIASPMFNAAATGTLLLPHEAWAAAIAYSLQLYFDFSAYSDMAIGLARLFSIRLPANFYSPYRATNIADFWRRWHMTLSRFLRDYLYIPLGGNRHGAGAPAREPHDHDAARRPLARRRLDLRAVGRNARALSRDPPAVDAGRAGGGRRRGTCGSAAAGMARHHAGGRRRPGCSSAPPTCRPRARCCEHGGPDPCPRCRASSPISSA